MIDLLEEKWENNTLSGTSKIIGADPYELRIAGLKAGKGWVPEKASIVDNSGGSSIEVLSQKEDGWVRVVIESGESKNVNWQISFKNQEM